MKHQTLVDKLYERLESKGYDSLEKNVLYRSRHGFDGEFDVVARRGNCWHYYEVKGRDTPKGFAKARHQFLRAQAAFPGRYWRFVYVTPERIQRLKYLNG